jgi:hypothetical protein
MTRGAIDFVTFSRDHKNSCHVSVASSVSFADDLFLFLSDFNPSFPLSQKGALERFEPPH